MMNKKAQSLGLSHTNFESPHGLDSPNHYTTPYELAIITDYALNNKIFKEIVSTKEITIYINNKPKTLTNTNELLGSSFVYGVKTGFTGNAGRCLVTAANNNDLDIIVIVLGSDTKNIRTSDSKKLINYAFDNYTLIDLSTYIINEFDNICLNKIHNIHIDKSFINTLNVQLKNYQTNTPYNLFYPVLKKETNKVTTISNDVYNIETPIYSDDTIFLINLYINDSFILSCEVVASENIPRAVYSEYFYYFFKNFKNIINNLQF